MAFVIPSIFTAVDQYSGKVNAMQKATMGFNASLRGLAVTAAATFGAAATGKAIMDYQDAVASFRTIVSDLNDTEFTQFQDKITQVANSTKKSTIDVAQSFEKIAGLNAKFAETADGLGLVSTAAITLAKASRMELGASAESLVGIMNQFSYGADQANKTINALAAGQAIGAASITNTADALNNFGATAAGANVTLEQSIALIQTMAKFGQMGADAGHRLRSALIKIQETGVGYQSGQFQINDALDELKKRYDAIAAPAAKDAFLTKTFGLEQITAGRILLSNIELYKEFTAQVTGTNEAQKAAAINTSTLSSKIEELKNKWITITTTSSSANKAVSAVSKAIGFLTDNLDAVLNVVVPLASAFIAYRTYVIAAEFATKGMTFALRAYEFIAGFAAVTTGTLSGAILENATAAKGAEFAMYGFGTSLKATIGLVGALLLGLYEVNNLMNQWKEKNPLQKELEKRERWLNTSATPIYDELKKKGYNDAQIELMANQGKYGDTTNSLMGGRQLRDDEFSDIPVGLPQAFVPQQTNTTNTQTIHHTVDIKQDGKTVAVFNTDSLTPKTSSTSSYS